MLRNRLQGCCRDPLRLMLPDDKLGADGFHDVIIENLSATPTWRSSHVPPADMTSLRRRWPKAVFSTLRRRAPSPRCPEKNGQGVSLQWNGFLWRLRYQDIFGTGRPHDGPPSGTGPVVALPCHLVRGMEGVGTRLFGTYGGKTWGIDAGDNDECCKIFSAMDCDSRRLAHCPPSGRVRGRRGRPAVSRGRTLIGASLPGL